MSRGHGRSIFLLRPDLPAADAHAVQIDDRFGENWKRWRHHPVGCGDDVLRESDGELVIDPAVFREPRPGVAVLGRNFDPARTKDILKILETPRVGFAD